MKGGDEREKGGQGGELGEDGESGELSSKKVNEDELSDSGSDGGGDSDAEEELRREQVLREKLAAAKKKFGGSHVKTINRTLKLVNCLIGEYKLNETEQLLDEIMPACREAGGQWYIKAIQSQAFNLFKQYKFQDALQVFHEQVQLVGPNGALYENMAHTYNSTGDYENAEKYFNLAMELVKDKSKKGGILLGIGLVKERKGDPRKALPHLKKALKLYQESHPNDGSSLIAKAHMSVGGCYETLGEIKQSIFHVQAAVRIFRKCVGNSPLTANALGTLGRLLLLQDDRDAAEPVLLESLTLEVSKDAFHPDTVWKLVNSLKELWTEGGRSRTLEELHSKCSRYVGPLRTARDRITSQKKGTYDTGTVAVIYKTAGELLMLAGHFEEANVHLQDAVTHLKEVKDFDCSSLIDSCQSSLRFIFGQTSRGGHRRPDSDSD